MLRHRFRPPACFGGSRETRPVPATGDRLRPSSLPIQPVPAGQHCPCPHCLPAVLFYAPGPLPVLSADITFPPPRLATPILPSKPLRCLLFDASTRSCLHPGTARVCPVHLGIIACIALYEKSFAYLNPRPCTPLTPRAACSPVLVLSLSPGPD